MTARERYEACTNALRSFAREAGFTDVVLGLSGGMDSALVACMCVDAMGAEHVHGVMLPGPYTSQASLEDAQEEADALGMHAEVVSILQPFEAFESALRKAAAALPDWQRRTRRRGAAWYASWRFRTRMAGCS